MRVLFHKIKLIVANVQKTVKHVQEERPQNVSSAMKILKYYQEMIHAIRLNVETLSSTHTKNAMMGIYFQMTGVPRVAN